MAPLLPIAIAGGSALVSKFIGGPKSSTGPDEQTQAFINQMRQFGLGGAQQVTGFDPETGTFSGPGAGPTAEQFGPESIERFLNPFLAGREAQIGEEFDISRARDIRGARQEATLAGTGRGSRGAVLEGLAGEASDRNRALALNDLRLRGFQQAGQLALGAQPFRNQALDANQLMERLRFGSGLLAAGQGGGGTVTQGPGPDPLATGISAGTIASQFFGGGGNVPFGPGDPLRPGPIDVAPPSILPPPGTDLSPSGLIARG
jgi:hypothetical protein